MPCMRRKINSFGKDIKSFGKKSTIGSNKNKEKDSRENNKRLIKKNPKNKN